MKNSTTKYIILFYFLIALLELTSEIFDVTWLRYISKPLLMIVLAIYFYISCTKPLSKNNQLMLFALFFAWGGDVALMFTTQFKFAFLIGLASFLLCHILYVFHFNKKTLSESTYKGFVFENKFILLPFIAYAYLLIMFVYQGLGDMKIPVFIYCAVIMCMCIVAINRYGRTNNKSAFLIIAGALSFMFSDSVIALNKFSSLFTGNHVLASIIIMTLYILGQYLIVEGSLKHEHQS